MSRAPGPGYTSPNFRNGDQDLAGMIVPLSTILPRLSLSRSAAYRLIQTDQFPVPVLRVGGRWMVRTADIDALFDS